MATLEAESLIGTRLGAKYLILESIGTGGMGAVYLASQEPFDRKVAIKVLQSGVDDETTRWRFEQEARAISKLQHPNTVTVFDYGHAEDGRPYIVMEHLKGKTLRQLIDEEGTLVPARALAIVRQICGSLAEAHALGIVHRDIKPENIFLSALGATSEWVKVLDFGLAKIISDTQSHTATGRIFGTPRYMSPEQAEGSPADPRSDLYSIAIILYELLLGTPPFSSGGLATILVAQCAEAPPAFRERRPDLQISPRLEAIVMRALAKDPGRRYQSCGELAAEIEAFERTGSDLEVSGGSTVAMPHIERTVGFDTQPVSAERSKPTADATAAPQRPLAPPPLPAETARLTPKRILVLVGGPLLIVVVTASIALAIAVLTEDKREARPEPAKAAPAEARPPMATVQKVRTPTVTAEPPVPKKATPPQRTRPGKRPPRGKEKLDDLMPY